MIGCEATAIANKEALRDMVEKSQKVRFNRLVPEKVFSAEIILSIVTGHRVAYLNDVYDALQWTTSEPVSEANYKQVCERVAKVLLRRHPKLAEAATERKQSRQGRGAAHLLDKWIRFYSDGLEMPRLKAPAQDMLLGRIDLCDLREDDLTDVLHELLTGLDKLAPSSSAAGDMAKAIRAELDTWTPERRPYGGLPDQTDAKTA